MTREDDKESNEEVNTIQVDLHSVVDRVESLLSLSLVKDLLDIVKSEGSEKAESSPKPDVIQGFAVGEEKGG